MTLQQAIADRRSIRRFLPLDVPEDKVLRVLESARLCQSAKNRQPWRFLVVRGGRRRQLAQLMLDWAEAHPDIPSSSGYTARVIRQAPVLILVFCEKDDMWRDADYLSIGGAMEHMCLTAQAEGLGALWIRDTVYAEAALRQAVGYPELDLAGAVALGYPAENPPMRPRLSLAELTLSAPPEPRREVLSTFWVMGREGSTEEGEGLVRRLWDEAQARFSEIEPLILHDASGRPAGVWGCMSSMDRRFAPWEEGFTRGLYLAGAECPADAQPPEGWTKWQVPGFEYLVFPGGGPEAFSLAMAYLRGNGMSLCGAQQDHTNPVTGQNEMFFPVRRL